MKAEEALRILLSSASNRECKHQLKLLLGCECCLRVLLRVRPGTAGNAPPITHEKADSQKANRCRHQAPLNTSYAPSHLRALV